LGKVLNAQSYLQLKEKEDDEAKIVNPKVLDEYNELYDMFMHIENISPKVITRLNKVDFQSFWEELSLPVENKYIPRNF
jgi:hypothetical protein